MKSVYITFCKTWIISKVLWLFHWLINFLRQKKGFPLEKYSHVVCTVQLLIWNLNFKMCGWQNLKHTCFEELAQIKKEEYFLIDSNIQINLDKCRTNGLKQIGQNQISCDELWNKIKQSLRESLRKSTKELKNPNRVERSLLAAENKERRQLRKMVSNHLQDDLFNSIFFIFYKSQHRKRKTNERFF